MGRLRLRLAVLAAMLCLPAIAAGQWLPTSEPLGGANYGTIQVSTSAGFGFQHMGVNLNLPMPRGARNPYRAFWSTSALDLELQDAGVWTGGIFVDARRNALSIFLTAEGNAPRA